MDGSRTVSRMRTKTCKSNKLLLKARLPERGTRLHSTYSPHSNQFCSIKNVNTNLFSILKACGGNEAESAWAGEKKNCIICTVIAKMSNNRQNSTSPRSCKQCITIEMAPYIHTYEGQSRWVCGWSCKSCFSTLSEQLPSCERVLGGWQTRSQHVERQWELVQSTDLTFKIVVWPFDPDAGSSPELKRTPDWSVQPVSGCSELHCSW